MSYTLVKKNEAYELIFPMVSTADNDVFIAGETVSDTFYYKDGAGAWTSLAITDTVSEIASTAMYEISLTAAEMNHDWIGGKFTSTNGQDTFFSFKTYAADQDDLVRSTTPSNNLTISAAGEVQSDIASINGTTITGDGSSSPFNV